MNAYDTVNTLALIAFCILRCVMELIYVNPKAAWDKLRGIK